LSVRDKDNKTAFDVAKEGSEAKEALRGERLGYTCTNMHIHIFVWIYICNYIHISIFFIYLYVYIYMFIYIRICIN
jgi:hypothetical protein